MLRFIGKISKCTAFWGVTDVSEESTTSIFRISQAGNQQAAFSLVITCLAYSSTMKMEAVSSF
jgi:hypothetical protein